MRLTPLQRDLALDRPRARRFIERAPASVLDHPALVGTPLIRAVLSAVYERGERPTRAALGAELQRRRAELDFKQRLVCTELVGG